MELPTQSPVQPLSAWDLGSSAQATTRTTATSVLPHTLGASGLTQRKNG